MYTPFWILWGGGILPFDIEVGKYRWLSDPSKWILQHCWCLKCRLVVRLIFLFLSSNIPSSPAYGVYTLQLIRYVIACSSYVCFPLRAARHSSKLFGQGYVRELRNSLSGSYMVDIRITSNIMKYPSPKCHMPFCDMTIYSYTHNWLNITRMCDLITTLSLLPNVGRFP